MAVVTHTQPNADQPARWCLECLAALAITGDAWRCPHCKRGGDILMIDGREVRAVERKRAAKEPAR